jgi:uncharacterized membrane protein HdeD (DUF308 family)
MRRLGPRDAPVMRRLARVLPALYGLRSVTTIVWVGAILLAEPSSPAGGPAPGFRTLVALYPLIDAVASAIDFRVDTTRVSRVAHGLEIGIGAATAASVLLSAPNWHSLTVVIGIWGIATGVVQLLVALRRVRLVHGQIFLVISGAGSVAAGLSFTTWSGNAHAFVSLVTQYATGGILWYVIAATWSVLLRPAREPLSATVP